MVSFQGMSAFGLLRVYGFSMLLFLVSLLFFGAIGVLFILWRAEKGPFKRFRSVALIIDRRALNTVYKTGMRTVMRVRKGITEYAAEFKKFPKIITAPFPPNYGWNMKGKPFAIFERLSHNAGRWVSIVKNPEDGQWYFLPQPVFQAVEPAMREMDKKFAKTQLKNEWWRDPFYLQIIVLVGLVLLFIAIVFTQPDVEKHRILLQSMLRSGVRCIR